MMKEKIMNKKAHLLISLTLLSTLTFACSFFSAPQKESSTPTQEIAPTEIPVETPTLAPTKIPAPALPIGVVTEKDSTLSLFDSAGYTLAQVNTPGLSYADENNVHIAGVFSQESNAFPVLYFSFEQNNSLLFVHNGEFATLISTPNFSGLAGAAGEPIIAYTTTEFLNDSLVSDLYVGTTQTLPTAPSILHDSDTEGWGMVALAVDVDAGQPSGVWFSKRPWGIGGDIVFEPRRTLEYLDLESGQGRQILGAEANPSAISANRKWVAYTDDGTVAGVGTMTIRNLNTGESLNYPLQTAVDQRGAGSATFSPSNQYLAWMEGNGWQMAEMPNFRSVIRIGDLAGNIITEFPDTALAPSSGMSVIQRVEPVGWLDDNTLIVMARGESWDDVLLLKIDIASRIPSFLAKGAFVGFAYP